MGVNPVDVSWVVSTIDTDMQRKIYYSFADVEDICNFLGITCEIDFVSGLDVRVDDVDVDIHLAVHAGDGKLPINRYELYDHLRAKGTVTSIRRHTKHG